MTTSQYILEIGSRTHDVLKSTATFLVDLSVGVVETISKEALDDFTPRLFPGDLDGALTELSKGTAAVVYFHSLNREDPFFFTIMPSTHNGEDSASFCLTLEWKTIYQNVALSKIRESAGLDYAILSIQDTVDWDDFGSTPNENFPWDHYLLVEAIVPAPGQKFSQSPIRKGPAFSQIMS